MNDRNKNMWFFEPSLVSESAKHRTKLTDFANKLASKTSGLHRSLSAGIVDALA